MYNPLKVTEPDKTLGCSNCNAPLSNITISVSILVFTLCTKCAADLRDKLEELGLPY